MKKAAHMATSVTVHARSLGGVLHLIGIIVPVPLFASVYTRQSETVSKTKRRVNSAKPKLCVYMQLDSTSAAGLVCAFTAGCIKMPAHF